MVGGTLTIANDCVTTVSGDGSVTTKPLENFVSGLNFTTKLTISLDEQRKERRVFSLQQFICSFELNMFHGLDI